jgi:hypothetical protein
MASLANERPDPLHWLFLLNTAVVGLASLPLLIAYPRVFAMLGIASTDNGFFVRLAGGLLLVEAIVSFLVWRQGTMPAIPVITIVLMKGMFILLVLLAAIGGTLPASQLLTAAAVDALFSVAFLFMLSRTATAAR